MSIRHPPDRFQLAFRVAFLALVPSLSGLAAGPVGGVPGEQELASQRQQFLQARQAWSNGQRQRYHRLLEGLENYPLYPYLRYQELRGSLNSSHAGQVLAFLDRHGDFPNVDKLRKRWLEYLASRGRWQEFLDAYAAGLSVRIDCLWLKARILQGQIEALPEDAIPLFLSGKSQPEECNPAFELLYQSASMSSDLSWQRIRLVMARGNVGLARHLGRRLEPSDQELLQQWIQIHLNPDRETRDPRLPDQPRQREFLLHGLQGLAKQNLDRAITRWQELRSHYSFSEQESRSLLRELAIAAVRRRHPQAAMLLDQIRVDDQELFDWRLRAALRAADWGRLVRWTQGDPEGDSEGGAEGDVNPLQRRYWHGRALEQLGQRGQARQVFESIAAERDYYGFLAADRLGLEYSFNHQPVPENPRIEQELLETPVIQRAREWYLLGMKVQARREWHHALDWLSRDMLPSAARLVAAWGWWDRAIFTLARAQSYDDLELRFPVLFEQKLREYAGLRDLDVGWIFGLVRAESAFIEDIRSPAGALGLMQVMPATGRMTARRIAWRNFNPKLLLQAEVNIPIGSAYLKEMSDQFDGDRVLSTAAYNAGPGRVQRWRRRQACVEPDIWIETIPFNETREYVKRVLFYASVYNWRLQEQIIPIQERMTWPDCAAG